jgi:glycosyltransferase involved in cell wall biosynthesis
MPNTLLEAISLGLPVVASNVGGISEIIKDGETGLLVDNIFNEDEYLEKLIQYTRMDNNNLNQVRKNAMCRLHAEHSWEKYRKTLHNIFK